MKFSILLVYFSKYLLKDIFHVEKRFRCFPCINYELTTTHLNNFLKIFCMHFLEYLNYLFFSMTTQCCDSSSLENVSNLWSIGNKYTNGFTNKQNNDSLFFFPAIYTLHRHCILSTFLFVFFFYYEDCNLYLSDLHGIYTNEFFCCLFLFSAFSLLL